MITRRRANVLLTADINSANINKPCAEREKRKEFTVCTSGGLPTKILNMHYVQLHSDLRLLAIFDLKVT